MLACRVSSAYQTGLLVVDLAVRIDDALGLVHRLVRVDSVPCDLRTLIVAPEAVVADGAVVERPIRLLRVRERVLAPVAGPTDRGERRDVRVQVDIHHGVRFGVGVVHRIHLARTLAGLGRETDLDGADVGRVPEVVVEDLPSDDPLVPAVTAIGSDDEELEVEGAHVEIEDLHLGFLLAREPAVMTASTHGLKCTMFVALGRELQHARVAVRIRVEQGQHEIQLARSVRDLKQLGSHPAPPKERHD